MRKEISCLDGQNIPPLFACLGLVGDAQLHFIDSILDAIPNPVFLKDIQGKYQRCNDAFARQILGLPKHRIINSSVYDFPEMIPGDLADIYHKKDLELIHHPGIQRYEAEVVCADGHRRIFMFNKATITNTDQEVLGMIGVMQDITEHRKQEHNLVQIVEGNPIPTFVIDKNHVITHWNSACQNLTGIPREKMIGTKNQWKAFYNSKQLVLADLVINSATLMDVRNVYGDKIRKSVIQGAYEGLDFFDRFGSEGKWLFFTASPLKDHHGNVIGAVETLQDFTKEILARNDVAESETRYRLLTENIADGVAIIQGYNITFANTALLNILGYSANELYGMSVRELIREDFKKSLDDIITSIKNGIAIDHFIAPYIRGDGNFIWCETRHNMSEWKGKPAALVTLRDITDTKLREEFLEEESEQLRTENIRLRSSIKDRYRMGNIIGKSLAMQEVYELILKASKTNASVIITGESGTGKELVARAIHDLSARSEMAFVPVNCGAIPDKLLESEFFGYKKGAFSDARVDKHGYLDLADKGSLFLDELGELDPGLQVKLLRAIDKKGYYPIGSSAMKHSDFRIIAATNRNLRDLVEKGAMREDFFFRLHVISIPLPPLRDRKEDLPLLIDHLLKQNNNPHKITSIPGSMMDQMFAYHWPGNVRELENMLHRFFAMGHIEFMKNDKPLWDELAVPSGIQIPPPDSSNLQDKMGSVEKEMIANALNQTRWNRTKASAMLGISRRALYRKMGNYHLNR